MTNRYRKLLFFLSLSLMVGVSPVEAETLGSLVTPGPDLLISGQRGDRLLTDLEQEIFALEAAGFTQWNLGNQTEAWQYWGRQLRLRQALPDRIAEVESLGRIGAIAWENNQTEPVSSITERLVAIEKTDFPQDYNLLLPLATAYEQIRDSQRAIALYRQHVATLADPYKPEILRLIAQLAQAWFKTDEALAALEEIKALNALTVTDREQLVILYKQTNQPEKAIATQQQLTALYLQDQDPSQLIRTYQDIAENYAQLQDYRQAVSFSRNAFTLAWEMRYFDAAESTLSQLAQLYLVQGKNEPGIQVYEQLLTVQAASSNHFGLMETYRTLGTLYQQAGRYPEARLVFQEGLAIAQELNHNINAFTQAIETLPLQ